MSQFDFGTINPDTKTGSVLATDLNAFRDAVNSSHSGAARPSYATAGMVWVNTSGTPWVVYLFDGADDIQIGTVNATTNVFVATNAASATSAGSIPSATDTVAGQVELATSAETITGTDTTRAVTPAGLQAKVASDTAKGIVELATSAETITGTDTTRAVTPAGLAAKIAFRGCLVKLTANYSLPNLTQYIIPFLSEEYDTSNIHSDVTNPTRLTVPSGITKVRLIAQAYISSGSGIKSGRIFKNGVTLPPYLFFNTVAEDDLISIQTPVIPVTPGDFFEFSVNQNSGFTVNLYASYTYFSMEVIE